MAQHAVLHISPRTRKHAVRGAGPRVADDTRAKLLDAAGPGFRRARFSGRDNSRDLPQGAGANVAAVNYTFGDKLGLYTEVLRSIVSADTDGGAECGIG